MICPSCFDRSWSKAFILSSNSPRYLAPAINDPMSSESIRFPRTPSGTSPFTMRCARPSTMAVLPTPGSPISTGLFFVRRCSICTVRRISSSLPMTGSSFPCSARSVRSIVNLCRAPRTSSASASFTFSPERSVLTQFSSVSRVVPPRRRNSAIVPPASNTARSNISLERKPSPRACANLSVRLRTRTNSSESWTSPALSETWGYRSTQSPSSLRNASVSVPALANNCRTPPSC